MIVGILATVIPLIIGVVVALIKTNRELNPPKQRTRIDDVADHFDALDRGDAQTFSRRRRRHLGDRLSRGLSGDESSDAAGPAGES